MRIRMWCVPSASTRGRRVTLTVFMISVRRSQRAERSRSITRRDPIMSSIARSSRRARGAAVAVLLAVLLAVPTGITARQFPNEIPPVPQDGTPFGADTDALAASWSTVTPARQVPASSFASSSSSEREEASTATQPDVRRQTATSADGGGEDGVMAAVPDDGLFDEESPSQPIVTAVNPSEFLEPPSADADADADADEKEKKGADEPEVGEVSDQDLFDEDTPQVPIVTAVDPDQFVDRSNKNKDKDKDKNKISGGGGGGGGDKPNADDQDAPKPVLSRYVDVDAIADAENAKKKKQNVQVDEIIPEEEVMKKGQKDHQEIPDTYTADEVVGTKKKVESATMDAAASTSAVADVEAESAPAPSPAPTPESDEAAALAPVESVPAVTAESPAEAPKATAVADSAEEWHAKKGHGRIPKKASAGIRAKKAEALAKGPDAQAPSEAPILAPAETPTEAPVVAKVEDDEPAEPASTSTSNKPSSSKSTSSARNAFTSHEQREAEKNKKRTKQSEHKTKDDSSKSHSSKEDVDVATSAPAPAPAPTPAPAPAPAEEEEKVAVAAAPVSSTSNDAEPVEKKSDNDGKANMKEGSDTEEVSEAIASAGAVNDSKNPRILSSAVLHQEPEDVVQLVKKVASYPSDCVPDSTAVLVQVNYHHIPLFHAQVKNVIQDRCFMRRYVLLALDGKTMDECRKIQANGVEIHCAKSKQEYAGAGSGSGSSSSGDRTGELSTEEMKDILFDRWTVVANVLEATPDLKLWVFDADVVIFKVPTLQLPDGCDFSTQLDKLDALGAADVEAVEQREAMTLNSPGAGAGANDDKGSKKGGNSGAQGYHHRHHHRLLLDNTAAAAPTLSLVPHKQRDKYNVNGGQVVLLSSKETISFLRAVGKRGENSDALDYMVMTQLMLDARGKEWESMTTCDLPETFSSACWGLAIDPFTFHANCVDSAEEKLKQMHNAVSLISSTVSPSTGEVTFAEGYPKGTKRYCWDQGMMCKGICLEGKLCEIDEESAMPRY